MKKKLNRALPVKRSKPVKRPKLTEPGLWLTDKQVRDLYNAKCDLYQVTEALGTVVRASQLRDITVMVNLIDEILAPVHKAEAAKQRAFHKKFELLEVGGIARWSVDQLPTARVCEGPARFVRTSGWAGPDEVTYTSETIDSPTYADAFKAFKESIDFTKDKHHVFFEGVDRLGIVAGVTIFTLWSGS